MRKFLMFITLLALASIAVAQDALPEPSFDPAVVFANAAALAASVAAVIAFVKQNVYKLSGWLTVAASFALAIAASVVASFTSVFDASVMEAVAFGVSAGLLASGGWDAIRRLLGKG